MSLRIDETARRRPASPPRPQWTLRFHEWIGGGCVIADAHVLPYNRLLEQPSDN